MSAGSGAGFGIENWASGSAGRCRLAGTSRTSRARLPASSLSWNGGQHGSDEAEARDLIRTSEIQRCGFRVIRFWNHEVIEQLDEVIEKIWNELYAAPTLTLPLEGEGN